MGSSWRRKLVVVTRSRTGVKSCKSSAHLCRSYSEDKQMGRQETCEGSSSLNLDLSASESLEESAGRIACAYCRTNEGAADVRGPDLDSGQD